MGSFERAARLKQMATNNKTTKKKTSKKKAAKKVSLKAGTDANQRKNASRRTKKSPAP